MAQGAHLAPANRDRIHVEELHVRNRAAVEPLEDLGGVRPLHLEAVVPANDRLPTRVRGGSIVTAQLHVEAAGLAVELDPVDGGRAPHEIELVRAEVEHDDVANHVAVVAARRELLGAVRHEPSEAVRTEMREQLQGIGSADEQLRHVVRLVEQDRRFTPRPLLVPPVGELTRHDRIHVGADRRIAQQLDGVAGALQHLFQVSMTHKFLMSLSGRRCRRDAPIRQRGASGHLPRLPRGPPSMTR
jgi:hypothetical protein